MRVKDIFSQAILPNQEVEILLAHVLKKDRTFLRAFPETELTDEQQSRLDSLVKRREKGEPLAYILGYQEFYGRKFLVNKDVLIPRADTEILVQDVLEFTKGKKLAVVDVGCGSGCIAITLKLENPLLSVIATEISQPALAVAKKNAALHGTLEKIQFLHCSLIDKVDTKLDVIVANLPYITTKTWENLPTEIRDWEPKVALESGNTKTILYKDLFEKSREKLNPGGAIFYEIDGKVFEKKFD